MTKKRLGKLEPRYSFILNQFKDTRVSRCPRCQQLSHMRKFALLIHVEGWGLFAQGKTCRYCTPCELIVCHQDELEDELVRFFEQHKPEVIGNPYLVMGTIELRHWKQTLGREPEPLAEALNYVADFKKFLTLHMEGGWQPMKPSRGTRKR